MEDFVDRLQDHKERKKKKEKVKQPVALNERTVDPKNLVENPSEEFTAQFGSILIAALILVIALAWKDFFKQVADQVFPNENILGMFIYAVVVTIILAIVVYFVAKHTNS